jgi:hypothetical protein
MDTASLSLANFVGCACPANAWVVGFLSVCTYTPDACPAHNLNVTRETVSQS